MHIAELLTRDSVLLSVKAGSYRAAIEQAAVHFSYVTELRPQQVLQRLLDREEKGSTALGAGVGLPHVRCPGLSQMHGMFMRFDPAIEGEAADGQPIDMAFVLLAPEDAPANYLRAVGKVAAILRSPEKRALLRTLPDKDAVFALLTSEDA